MPETDTLQLTPARSGKARPRAFFGLHQSIGAPGKRANMEDAAFAGEIATAGGLTLTLGIAADGIGGANAGERASALAVECILEAVREARGNDIPAILADGLRYANRSVFEEGLREASRRDMGTTATIAAICESRLYLASVGDSRAYLVRNRKARQITVDHSWEGEMVRAGRMSAAEAALAVHAKALMRSIGADREVDVDLGLYLVPGESEADAAARQGMVLQPGDAVLLCSDGLIKERPDGRGNFVETREIPGLINNRTAAHAAQVLVQKAVSRRANDNVSAVVLGIPGGAGGALWRGLKTILAG